MVSLLSIFSVVLTCSSCGKENAATTMNLIKAEGTVDVNDAKGKLDNICHIFDEIFVEISL